MWDISKTSRLRAQPTFMSVSNPDVIQLSSGENILVKRHVKGIEVRHIALTIRRTIASRDASSIDALSGLSTVD